MNKHTIDAAEWRVGAHYCEDDTAVRLVRERAIRSWGFAEDARDARAAIRCVAEDAQYHWVRCLIASLEAIRA